MPRPKDLPVLLLLATLPGCDGCHGSRPYTPYTLSDPPAGSARPDAGAAVDRGTAFPAVADTAAPRDGKAWPIEGGLASAPAGHAFAEGLVFDADGDQKPDLLAWSRAPNDL